jgi:hypothetical protein
MLEFIMCCIFMYCCLKFLNPILAVICIIGLPILYETQGNNIFDITAIVCPSDCEDRNLNEGMACHQHKPLSS